MKNQYRQLIKQHSDCLKKGNIGILCNQVSFDPTEGKYLFQILKSLTDNITLFVPEHGLFAEQQDQVLIESLGVYRPFGSSIHYESLYKNSDNKLGDLTRHLSQIYTLIIDIQDVGVRYYTYVTTIAEIFKLLAVDSMGVDVIVIDKPNPAGRQVEGTLMEKDYSSLIGLAGIPHRYGLSIGELCLFLRSKYRGKFKLDIIKYDNTDSFFINPSPNIPSKMTCSIYSGQCLLEGTNLSEGRGTTRPFEIFGAPFLKYLPADWAEAWNNDNREAVLRPLLFVPGFNKYKDEICYGFQLHPLKNMHSLSYTLKLLRSLKQEISELRWLEGPYEAGSDRPALELLVGDKDLIGFLDGHGELPEIMKKIKDEEQNWMKLTQPFLLYPDPLISVL